VINLEKLKLVSFWMVKHDKNGCRLPYFDNAFRQESVRIEFSEFLHQIEFCKLYPHLYFRIWLSIDSIWKFNSIQCVLKILLFIYPTGVYSFKAISRPINISKVTNDRNSRFRPRFPKFSLGRVGQQAIFSCQQHRSASLDVRFAMKSWVNRISFRVNNSIILTVRS